MGSESWPPWEVVNLARNLGDLEELVGAILGESPGADHLSWLARLLIVRSSGYVEQSVRELARAFVERKSGGFVRSFAQSWLERTHNPSPESLVGLLGRFDATLAREFEAFLDDDDQRLRRDLSFMVDRRNRIAHGLNESVGPARAVALAQVAREVTDWFILRLNPLR